VDPVVPSGWLNCNGQTVIRSTYPSLWALAVARGLVGTIFGAGDGATTFTLPSYSASLDDEVNGGTPQGLGSDSGVLVLIKT
jgi:microcystin-dependent protein